MRTDVYCMECFVRQAISAARRCGADEAVVQGVMRETLGLLEGADYSITPPATAAKMYEIIHRLTGEGDPYLDEKRHFNAMAMAMRPQLREIIAASADPFETAVRLAIAGNIIDFGILTVSENRVEEMVRTCLTCDIDAEAIDRLQAEVQKARRILYLCDNAGEIVFDTMLIEQLPREKVTAVVKGGPIINDALMEDARAVGLCDMVEVVDNGSAAPGTLLELCSADFGRRFAEADLVISKGQGNFETLEGADKNIFFLFTVKCNVVSDFLAKPFGTATVLRNTRG
jgi:damage-control phosphatase, subfamily I